jgi:hypothetical protein
MSGLMGTLGLDKVEADPNAIPDGKYVGEVMKDEYVHVAKNDTVSHVFTYRVTDGPHKGAQRTEWFQLGTNPTRDENGNITGLDVTMTEQAKQWYKKRFTDLGVPDAEVPNQKPGDQVGKKINFGVKRNGAYINVNFVELRQEGTTSQAVTQESLGGLV